MDSDNDSYVYDSDESGGAFPEGDSTVLESSLLNSSSTEPYVALPFEEVKKEQDMVIQAVCETLGLSTDVAATLLSAHGWSVEAVSNSYLGGADECLEKAHVLFHKGVENCAQADPERAVSGGKRRRVTCPIEYEDFDVSETFCMQCDESHRFSLCAWREYLKASLSEFSKAVTCPAGDCACAVPPSVFQLVLEGEDFEKFQVYYAQSFVDQSKRMAWCPSQECSSAHTVVVSNTPNLTEYACPKCRKKSCFKCSEDAHRPLNCAALRKWKAKCADESETANWMLVNTKSCPNPKCGVRIEKNQGCNHMTCRTCGKHFCWVCLQDWGSHGNESGGYYNCNRFREEETDPSKATESQRAQNDLKKYLHYYSRYQNHSTAGKFASKKIEEAEAKMDELATTNNQSLSTTEFLRVAADTLVECRRVLQYTYGYAYFLEAGPFKNLFEDAQSVLEQHTESLSELVEREVDRVDPQETANRARVTRQALESLLVAVEQKETGDGAYGSLADA